MVSSLLPALVRHLRMGLFTSLTAIAAMAANPVRFVDADAGGANDGSSWEDAFTDLQDALDVVEAGDEIWVAAGTYKPSVEVGDSGARYATFQMKNGVGIYGGFAGTETARSQRDWQANVTILSGDLGTIGDNADNAYRVFYHPASLALDGTAILDGVTITGGNADGTSDQTYYGGGMINRQASPTLSNCIFTGNYAAEGGGGLYNHDASSPRLIDCTISANATLVFGGGIYNTPGCSPILINCTIAGNSAGFYGGGMANDAASPTMINCAFVQNSAGHASGGGMSNFDASPVLTNCTFSANSATFGGAMANLYGSTPSLTNCIMWNNVATDSDPEFKNYDSDADIPVVTYSIVAGGHDGTGNLDADPLFVDAANGDFRLQSGSPAIDAGSNAALPADLADLDGDSNTIEAIPYDLDGTARVKNDTVDMGAYEFLITNVAPVAVDDSYSIGSDNLLTVSAAGVLDNDADGDGDQLTATVLAGVSHGVLALAADGSFTYMPADGYSGPDSFTYTVSDGTASDTGTVNLTVEAIDRTLSIGDVTGSEGDAHLTFTVTLSEVSGRDVTFLVTTVDGSAAAPGDYSAGGGILAIAAGQLTTSFAIPLVDDALHEATESFTVELSNPNRATIADAIGVGTVTDNDAKELALAIAPGSMSENGGSAIATVSHNLADTGGAVAVTLANSDPASATLPATVTILAGSASATFAVSGIDNGVDDGNRQVTVTASAATFADATDTVEVTNDDVAALSIGDVTVSETAGSASFAVSLSLPSAFTVTADYATGDLTTTANSDYAAASGTLAFAPGQLATTITVTIHDDLVDEPNESFAITLSNAPLAPITDGIGIGTILDNGTASLSIADLSAVEGAGHAMLPVTLSTPSSFTVTVTASTVAGTATAGADFTATTVALTFAPGETEKTVSVPIVQDDEVEGDESFQVRLTGVNNAGLSVGSATVTIIDDDAPLVGIAAATAAEGQVMTFAVTLDRPSPFVTSAIWSLAPGTAVAGGDYLDASGTVTFAPGVTSHTIMVSTVDDGLNELAETFTVTLAELNQLAPGTLSATGTIIDNDPPGLTVTLAADRVGESEGTATATLTRNTDTAAALIVSLTGSDPTEATAPATVTIPAGSYTATFAIAIVDDTTVDGDQPVTFTATASAHASASATLTVVDDDKALSIVYTLSVRGNQYSPRQTLTGNGLLVIDLERHLVTVLIRWADGTAERQTWFDRGLWYTATLDRGRTYWFLTSTDGQGEPGSYDYAHLYGEQYPTAVDLGGETAFACAEFEGEWRYGDTVDPTRFGTATLAARIDLATGRDANRRVLSHAELCAELIDRYDLDIPAPAAIADPATTPASTGEGLICYSLDYVGFDAGNGALASFDYSGYLLLDLATGESRVLIGWRDAAGYWYAIQDWTPASAFRFRLTNGSDNYLFYGGNDSVGDGFRFRHLHGPTRTGDIGGTVQEYPVSLAGSRWSHTADGETWTYGQAAVACTLGGPDTLAINRGAMAMSEAMAYLVSRLPAGYRSAE